jgi:hypothetical protein
MKKQLFCLLTCSLSITFSSLYAQVPNDNLVGYWPFNGDANDESQNGNDGINHGAIPTTDRFGNESSAFYFDGIDDYIELPDDFDFLNRTICAWFSVDSINYYDRIYSSDHPGLTYGQTKILVNEKFGVDKLSMTQWISQDYFDINICEDRWHFVCMAIEGNTINYYVNGLHMNTVSNDYIQSNQGLPVAIVGSSTSLNRFFCGKIDDIRIYEKALNQEEVIKLYAENYHDFQVTDTVLVYDSISVTDTLMIDCELTDINSNEIVNRVKVYPNPAKEYITIDLGNYEQMSDYVIQIINSSGQTVFQTSANQKEFILQLDSFGGYGIYFFRIIDDMGELKEVRKIILE